MKLESCTAEVQIADEFDLDGRRVLLIDTPGFDDTSKSDTEVLRMIAAFLATTYAHTHPSMESPIFKFDCLLGTRKESSLLGSSTSIASPTYDSQGSLGGTSRCSANSVVTRP